MKETKWNLRSLTIEQKSIRYCSKEHNSYEAKIRFMNDEWESFDFNLNSEQTAKYLELIAAEVIKSAESLGKKIAESLTPTNKE